MSILKTLMVNLNHGAKTDTPALIGGGEFSVCEQRQLVTELTAQRDLLAEALRVFDDVDDPDLRCDALINKLQKALKLSEP
jgi:hypothetical protein